MFSVIFAIEYYYFVRNSSHFSQKITAEVQNLFNGKCFFKITLLDTIWPIFQNKNISTPDIF